jgi:Phage integrase, N-terminal SAM-like domain/Arm DNA-binding domain
MRTKIGLKAITAIQPNAIIWDATVRGFNARRQKSEAVTFSVFYRSIEGTQRWHRIGRFGVWTADQARKEAQRVLIARDLGEDPSGARMAVRQSPTVAELLDEYIADMQSGKVNGKKGSTIYTDNIRIKKHIAPHLGKLKVASVTQAHIEDCMNELPAGSAKRIIGLTGAIFSFAIKRKMQLDNPCSRVEKPKDVSRNRRLNDAEYTQLGKALNGNMISEIFLFLAVTGFRSGEAKNLRWDECDLERRI